MKGFKKHLLSRITVLLLICSAVFVFNGCHFFESSIDNEETDYDSLITSVSFTSTAITVYKGEKANIKVNLNPSEYQNRVYVSWETGKDEDGNDIIEISSDNYGAMITGKKAGNTWIKAKCNGIVTTCLVTVLTNGEEAETDPYIYSNDAVIEMLPDKTYTLAASLYGGSVEDMEDFIWEIKNTSVAEIIPGRNNCIVKSHNPGSTTITARHPKAKYEYTFIVYVFTDKLTIPYITTAQNVMTIDRNESERRTVTVDLKNPYTSSYINDFKFELADSSSADIVEISSSQNQCQITGKTNGIARIKVTHPQSEYPLYIVVRVTTIVKNVYIGLSQTTLVINGSDSMYQVVCTVENYDGVPNLEKFTYEISSGYDKLAEIHTSGNVISVRGKKNGKITIKVGHELSELKRTLLIILQEQIGSAVDSSMYITTEQNYVQTKVGAAPTVINVRLIGGEEGVDNVSSLKEENFNWYIPKGKSNGIVDVGAVTGWVGDDEVNPFRPSRSVMAAQSGKECSGKITITPLKAGETSIYVTHPRCLYETAIRVKVLSEYALTEPPVLINSNESIIRLVNGNSKEITPSLKQSETELEDYIKQNLKYSSDDVNGNITVSPEEGVSTVISAKASSGKNQAYVTVSHEKALAVKKILVLSADTQAEVDSMKAMWTNVSYARLSADRNLEENKQEIEVSTTGFESTDNITWTSSDSSVVTVCGKMGSPNNSTGILEGVSEGRAKVTASITGCLDIVIDVTVVPVGESVLVNEEPRYLTTGKNTIVIEPEEDNTGHINPKTEYLSVTGVNITEPTNYKWELKTINGDNDAFILNDSGTETASITAYKKGKSEVTVSHPQSKNSIKINVKCGSVLEWTDGYIPYIVCENGVDVVNMVNGETVTIGCAIENSSETGRFGWNVTQGFSNIEIMGSIDGVCTITAKNPGQSIITVSNSVAGEVTKEILVNVANSEEELKGFKYLTTKDNVVNVGQGQNKTVSVSVINSANPVLSGYTWSPTDSTKIDVTGSGSTAVILGKELGTSRVIVQSSECDFPLEIIVNVVDPLAVAQDPYISCQNIITVPVGGNSVDIAAELVGGTDYDNTGFSWSSEDPSVAQVYGSNSSAKIKAVKAGVTRVVVQHPKAAVARRILVICEEEKKTDCYITVPESIIKMAPSDEAKEITATLVGGSDKDIYDFKWWADDYKIISMNYAQNCCTIKPIASGSVNIHVSHPKAANTKDIVLYISQYNEFTFSEKTAQVETGGSSVFIPMEVPAINMNCEVSFSSSDPEVCTAWGNTTVCALQPGSKEGSATITARLVTKGGAVQGTSEILVANVKRNETKPYIGVNGSTIEDFSVGEKKKIVAALYGSNLIDTSSAGLKWEIEPQYQNIIKFATSVKTGKEVQIEALNPGKAFVTVRHDPDNSHVISPVRIFINVRGTSEPTIAFNYTNTRKLLVGEDATTVSAVVSNDDGGEITWNISQSEEGVLDVLIRSPKCIITPKKPGNATITGTLSNGSTATLNVIVEEPPRLEFFVYKDEETGKRTGEGEVIVETMNVYPLKSKYLHYRSVPKKDPIASGTAGYYISDNESISYSDEGYGWNGYPEDVGTVKITGKEHESRAPAEFSLTTVSHVTKAIALTNNYNYSFVVDKTAVINKPQVVCSAKKTDSVKYSVTPSCCKLQIAITSEYVSNTSNFPKMSIKSKDGSTKLLTPVRTDTQNKQVVYEIDDTLHQSINPVTETAEGEFWFNPDNEFYGNAFIQAVNIVQNGSETVTTPAGNTNIILSWYYVEHTFDVDYSPKTGKSVYKTDSNMLELGDGETVSVTATVKEPYSFMNFSASKDTEKGLLDNKSSGRNYNSYIKYSDNSIGGPYKQKDFVRVDNTRTITNTAFTQKIIHNFSYDVSHGLYITSNSESRSWTVLSSLEKDNNTVKEMSYVGSIDFAYTNLVGDLKHFYVPVYVFVRNCN